MRSWRASTKVSGGGDPRSRRRSTKLFMMLAGVVLGGGDVGGRRVSRERRRCTRQYNVQQLLQLADVARRALISRVVPHRFTVRNCITSPMATRPLPKTLYNWVGVPCSGGCPEKPYSIV